MKSFLAALSVEFLKIRKSKIVWVTMVALAIAPVVGGLFMFILKNPESAYSSGMLGAKAQIAGEANWPSYFALLAQAIAVGGILVFGFVFSWIFGREYSDRTVKDLLAISIPRAYIVAAKFLAATIWCILLSFMVFVVGLAVGFTVELPAWSMESALNGLTVLSISAVLTIALSFPVAFFASFGGGYLAPLGYVVLTLVLAQIIAAMGHGAFFPWSIPALYSNIAGPETEGIGTISFVIVYFTGFLGFIATLSWWSWADQHG